MLNNGILLEITKCCGYSEIHSFHKNTTLAELHANLIILFELYRQDPICNLYTKNNDGTYSLIDKSEVDIRAFIRNNNLLPVYGLPAKVVYRIFIDDGHVHSNEDICHFKKI
jgi:hypothetical protein